MPLMPALRSLWPIFKGATFEWAEDKAPRMAAAVAFYAVFSFTPIVMIVLALASFFFDREPAQREVFAKIQFLVGSEGVDAIRTLIANAPFHTADWFTTVFGLATVIFAATGAFS